MSRPVIAIALVLAAAPRFAEANQPLPDLEEREMLERWSWSPLLSAVFAAASRDAMPDQTAGLYSAELRVRWGKARGYNDRHGEDTPKLFAVGTGIASRSFGTIEPYGVIGLHYLPTDCDCMARRLWLDLRIDVGAGRAFEDGTGKTFVRGKLGLGALFSEPTPQINGRHKTRFRSQLDFIVIADTFTAGGYRLGFGIEFDPFHGVGDANRYVGNHY